MRARRHEPNVLTRALFRLVGNRILTKEFNGKWDRLERILPPGS
jgi:hypothetical protein